MALKLRIGFVLDPIEQLDVEEDTSLMLFNECRKRGHETFYIQQEDIFVSDRDTMVNLSYADFDERFNAIKSERKIEPMKSLDIVFMRLEPPYNLNYFYITHMLQLIGGKTLIVNNPKGLREVNEKLYPLRFNGLIPKTIVTKDINLLKMFLKTNGKMIIKQINMFASKDIVVVSVEDKNAFQIFDNVTESKTKYVIGQEFIDELYKTGDKRALMFSGEILGCYTRIPKNNDFRSDPDFGGFNKRTEFTKKEKDICNIVSKKLLEDGICFAGIDIIGEKLTEVNVTCPAGIIPINNFYGKKLEKDIVNTAEKLFFKKN